MGLKGYLVLLIVILLGILTLLTLSGRSLNRLKQLKNFSGNTVTRTGKVTNELNMTDVDNLKITNITGVIEVGKTDSEGIRIRMEMEVDGKNEEEVKSVLDNIKTSAKVRGDSLEVKAVTKDEEDFWKWKNRNYMWMNVNIKFYVQIPKNFKNYEINNVTGSIALKGLTGSVKVENTTGNINLEDMSLQGLCKINLLTGNIDIKTKIDDMDGIDISNTTGNITLALPSKSSFDVNASIVTGQIGGSFSGISPDKSFTGTKLRGSINGGGKRINIKLITGNIDLNNK